MQNASARALILHCRPHDRAISARKQHPTQNVEPSQPASSIQHECRPPAVHPPPPPPALFSQLFDHRLRQEAGSAAPAAMRSAAASVDCISYHLQGLWWWDAGGGGGGAISVLVEPWSLARLGTEAVSEG